MTAGSYKVYLVAVFLALGSVNTAAIFMYEMVEAEEYYNKSLSFYKKAYYENASFYGNKSLTIYLQLNYPDESEKVQELLDKINANLEKKREADKQYERAVGYLKTNQLIKAEINADKAKSIYKEIKWGRGIQKCEQLQAEIEEKKEIPPLERIPPTIIPLTLLLIILLIIRQLIKNKSSFL